MHGYIADFLKLETIFIGLFLFCFVGREAYPQILKGYIWKQFLSYLLLHLDWLHSLGKELQLSGLQDCLVKWLVFSSFYSWRQQSLNFFSEEFQNSWLWDAEKYLFWKFRCLLYAFDCYLKNEIYPLECRSCCRWCLPPTSLELSWSSSDEHLLCYPTLVFASPTPAETVLTLLPHVGVLKPAAK